MKKYGKKISSIRKALVLAGIGVVILMAFVSLTSGTSLFSTETTSSVEPVSLNKNGLTAHEPIYINGNSDFTSQASNESWAGNGTETNPYIIENWDINASTAHGIEIRNTDQYFIIKNCRVGDGESNYYKGIWFYNVTNGKIDNITSEDNYYGIHWQHSPNNIIINCVLYDNHYSIDISLSSNNNQITNCTIYDSFTGIFIYDSSNCNLRDNILYNNSRNFGVQAWTMSGYSHDIDISNTINGNHVYYIIGQSNLVFDGTISIGYLGLVSCSNITVKNLNLTHNILGILLANTTQSKITNCVIYNDSSGIYLFLSSNNDLSNCTLYNNSCGIRFESSSNNIISNYTIYNNSQHGIRFYKSPNNIVTNSSVYDNSHGICFDSSPNNTVTNCTCNNNSYGSINLFGSANNTVTGNTFINSGSGVYIGGDNLEKWTQNIGTTNTVNGKPIYYFLNQNNITIDGWDVGQLILANCTDFILKNISIIYTTASIQLGFSTNVSIVSCIIHNSFDGIIFTCSINNQISACDVYDNYGDGICFDLFSNDNTLSMCNIYNNDYGIEFYDSSNNNTIYHNNFINNTNNAYDYSSNYWDYNGEGNYWSDYTGVDENGDGIGDTPYTISGGSNQDHYPFINPSGWEELSELMPHEPIYISGNDDFTPENGVVSGSGTETDPYIVENWDINASSADGIEIENTDAYFIIRNCIIHDGWNTDCWDSYHGIHFYNVQNGKIDNVASYNNWEGIHLYYSSKNNIISNCTVYNNSKYGFRLGWYSSNNQIINCNVYNNFDVGINLYFHSNSQITNCTIYNHNHYGIWLGSYSNNNNIANCDVYNNSYGVYLVYSSNNKVHYCNIYNNTNYEVENFNSEAEYQIDTTYNWWGSADGPSSVGANPVSGNVLYDPWLIGYWGEIPPEVMGIYPENGSVDVPVDTGIEITFSESMNVSTIIGNITVGPETGIQNYGWSDNNTTLTLTFVTNLSSYTQYTIMINTNLQDDGYVQASDGTMHYVGSSYLQTPYQFLFRTKEITPPIITIVSPANNTITNQSITLIYLVSDNFDDAVNITVIGPDNNTVYSDEKSYTITVNATDRAGNTVSKTISFIIDKTSPTITISSPEDGLITNQDVTLEYSFSDNVSSAENITVTGDGSPYTEDGSYSITLTATDQAGNMAEKTITFTIDKTKPGISELTPVTGTKTTKSSIVVSGKTEPDAVVKINGVDVLVSFDGSFSKEVTLVKGENTITITATDLAGNTKTETIIVTKTEKKQEKGFIPSFELIYLISAICLVLAFKRRKKI